MRLELPSTTIRLSTAFNFHWDKMREAEDRSDGERGNCRRQVEALRTSAAR
jgi:hypothetical protein